MRSFRPGVYVLKGPDDEDSGGTRLYVGEADSARKRLDQHLRNVEWWEHLYVFTSKDENLNKAHVRHLESRLIDLANQAKRVRMTNGNAPKPPRLSEADLADAEGFLENMLILYPVLGIDAFEIPRNDPAAVAARPLLHIRGKKIEAQGRDLPEGFVVYKGAAARDEITKSMPRYMRAHRERLISDRVIETTDDGMKLTQDYVFSSPSLAAAVLLGLEMAIEK